MTDFERQSRLHALRVCDAIDNRAYIDTALPDDATGYVRIVHDEGRWCIRARARNGRLVVPNDGYTEREHAVDGLATLREVLRSPLIDAGD